MLRSFILLLLITTTSGLIFKPLCENQAQTYHGNCSTTIVNQIRNIFNGSYVQECNCLALRNVCLQTCRNETCYNECIKSYELAHELCGCSNPSTIDIYMDRSFIGCKIERRPCPVNQTVNITSIRIYTCYLDDITCQNRIDNKTASVYECVVGYTSMKNYHVTINWDFILTCIFAGLSLILSIALLYTIWCRRQRILRSNDYSLLLNE